ncbi:MAG: SUMF1/EgtB/PvdO family nonheme iron enzyme [Gemmatimonadetes bacterium]|nr:SUMF1/EgtB/PvdO family nonheme iron enzyme [Gemmatimonadota bacterium]
MRNLFLLTILGVVRLAGSTVAVASLEGQELPPEIAADALLVRAERLLDDDRPYAAFGVLQEILDLRDQHDLVLDEGFLITYARVAMQTGRPETALAAVDEYLLAVGREGAFYRTALELRLEATETIAGEKAEREAEERARAAEDSLILRQLEAAATPTRRDTLSSGRQLAPEMVRIAPGGFLYGGYSSVIEEQVETWVEIKEPFEIGRYEVTVRDFALFVSETDFRTSARRTGHGCSRSMRSLRESESGHWLRLRFEQTADHPVVCVSIYDALAYVEWLSRETGATYRLPSAAEWQYAARAGSRLAMRGWLSDENRLLQGLGDACAENWTPDEEVSCSDDFRWTAPVGQFAPNAVGLHDMHGNVSEMVMSCSPRTRDGRAEHPDNCGPRGSLLAWGGNWNRSHRSRNAWQRVNTYVHVDRVGSDSWERKVPNSSVTVGFRVVRDARLP